MCGRPTGLQIIAAIIVCLGAPFAFLTGTRGAVGGLAVAISIGIVYWAVAALLESMGTVGLLPPVLAGWAPDAGGSEYAIGGKPLQMEPALEREVRAATSEAEIDRIMTQASFRYARENPRRWVHQRIRSFVFFWHEHNFWAPYSPFRTPLWRIIGYLNLIFVGFFFYMVFYAVRGRGPILLILSILALHSLIYTMIHADIGSRYRYQIEPLMLVVIAYGLMVKNPFGFFGDRKPCRS